MVAPTKPYKRIMMIIIIIILVIIQKIIGRYMFMTGGTVNNIHRPPSLRIKKVEEE